MERFTRLKSRVIPLALKDIDTDMIIPAQFLTSVSRSGYGENLFRRLREQDPNFVLNQDRYLGAEILLSDSNFGCGSSREHAVWALLGWGIRVILAKSFADIFASNAAKNGLLLITLPAEVIDSLLEKAAEKDLDLEIDLEAQRIRVPSGEICFEVDPFRKHCILNGLDDLDYLLSQLEQIREFKSKQALLPRL